MSKKVTVSIELYTKRKLKNDKYPIKIKVYFNYQKKYFGVQQLPIPITQFTKAEFNLINSSKNISDVQLLNCRNIIIFQQSRLQNIANSIFPFNFEIFKAELYGHIGGAKLKERKNDMFNSFEEIIEKFREEDRIGSADSYRVTLMHLRIFAKSKELPFKLVTPDFLEAFSKYLLSDKTRINSKSSVGIYMRNIRRVYNVEKARADSFITLEDYPFGKDKYKIKVVKQRSVIALDKTELDLIKNYHSDKYKNRVKARDLWLFSYYGNGLNGADILRLKFKDVKLKYQKQSIEFERIKIINTATETETIEFMLTQHQLMTINKYGNKDTSPNNFIFSGLKDDMNEVQRRKEVAKLNQFITKNMKRITKELGIEKEITAIAARHTFATVLNQGSFNTNEISELLGHKSIETTKHYLAKLNKSKLDEVSDML